MGVRGRKEKMRVLSVTLDEKTLKKLDRIAVELYDGNRSMTIRHLVKEVYKKKYGEDDE
jgi:metal-responsive CopG/Arc/MetJ family transcriptional regulator